MSSLIILQADLWSHRYNDYIINNTLSWNMDIEYVTIYF